MNMQTTMIDKYIQVESLAIVLRGKFNPAIFQPAWLALKELVPLVEAENANKIIIHQDIAQYSIGDWVLVEVTRERCLFRSNKKNYFSQLIDLLVGIFRYLGETPISAIGINPSYELSLIDSDKYYEFGNRLCPLQSWSVSLNDPRLLELQIIENSRNKSSDQKRTISITPSSPEFKISFGIRIEINNHYDFSENTFAKEAIKALSDNYLRDIKESKEILNNILETTLKV